MTAYAPALQASPRRSPLPLLLLLAVVAAGLAVVSLPAAEPALNDDQVALAMAQVIVDEYSHAATEHPEDMPAVRGCLGDRGTWKQVFRTQQPNRYLRVCYDGVNIIFQIIDHIRGAMRERTAYIRDDLANLNQLREYTERVGYSRIKSIILQ